MRVRWVKVWVDSLATLTERFRDDEGRVDFEALGREEYAFRHALVTGDFSRSERARDLYDATINEITSRSEAGRRGAEARWSKKTAAATTREGVDESTTGCNPLTADASTREGEDERDHRGNTGTLESSTSANHYDQEAAPTSTNGPRQAEARQGQRAGENSVRRVEKVSTSPVRSSGPAKRPHGEFGNVLLTDDEFAKLCEKCDDANSLVTELDQYIESQGKAKKYKSHYATLLNWSRRKAQEAKPKQGYLTSDDISKKNYQESKARLEAMFSKGRETA